MTTLYKFVVDSKRHTVAFTLDKAANDIAKCWNDHPMSQAVIARAAAAYFLEMAHKLDHCDDFTPPDFSENARAVQFAITCEENPVSCFELWEVNP